MKALVAVLMAYGCLAMVAAMIFTTSGAYAAPLEAAGADMIECSDLKSADVLR